ncbi:hypothetical protein ACQ86G_22950 [Roseateles chitinivorans]|uniref:hypothetical protein n=1 Tax=Roseateles chitinivorans TaxID=2917965 RepID=UPI003D66F28A
MRMTSQPLLGLRMGLLCGDERAPGAMLFQQLVLELGAQVTVLEPARVLEDGAALEEIARLLGRLYGAIACDGLPPAVVRRLSAVAVVPVVDVQATLASAQGPGKKAAPTRRRPVASRRRRSSPRCADRCRQPGVRPWAGSCTACRRRSARRGRRAGS